MSKTNIMRDENFINNVDNSSKKSSQIINDY